ncbi:MAG: metallophosphoesterase family protein [Oscillospiraceae bacterium]|nr:metallophosphoesterase family protein [Oscillospiraceae bacterium]
MKIAVLSDIHGNYYALKIVIDDILRQNADEIYSLGDQTGLFPYLDKALDLLDEHNVICLQGNFEDPSAKHYGINRDFSILPRVLHIEREGVQIMMGHMEELVECPENGLHLFGHTHDSYFHKSGSKYKLNPGSVGDPKGRVNLAETRYAMLEIYDGVIQVSHRALTYSTEQIWRDFISTGCYDVNPVLSRLLMEMMETGVSNSIFGRFFRHVKSMGYLDEMPDYPHEIWDKAAESFAWKYPNKFDGWRQSN